MEEERNTITIPKDFEGRVIPKDVVGDTDTIVIYFDEDKWNLDYMCAWFNALKDFFECPILLLPKSFSELAVLAYDQLLLLKTLTDKAIEEIDNGTNCTD